MGTMDEELEETRVGGGRGEGIGEEVGGGVSVSVGSVGVITVSVEVKEADVGKARLAVAVDCGSKTSTWKEQALVNNNMSRIKFLFIG